MKLDPKRKFKFRTEEKLLNSFEVFRKPVSTESTPVTKPEERQSTSNQDLAEKHNLEKLKKSLKDLIIEQKEGGTINSKKIKTFSL